MGSLRAYTTLGRWLGPWADETAVPRGVTRRTVVVPGADPADTFDAWVYTPMRRASGAYVIAPGLHYAGPADPRLDRFCAVLAAAGLVVFAPFIRDYTSLVLRERAIADFGRAFDAALALPEVATGSRVGVFSVSFGSTLALHLAADPARAARIGGVVAFGGYADFDATIRFCLTGEIDGRRHGPRDPLNQPVVFMNLLDAMTDAPADPAPLMAAWRRYIEATWGRPELKVDRAYHAVAEHIAAELPTHLRDWFLIGCGVLPDAVDRCMPALARRAHAHAYLDPRPHLSAIRCPVHLVHGIDDDVIPYPQSEALARALPDAHLYLTGLYGHTAQASARPTALARELWTMLRMMRALVATGAG